MMVSILIPVIRPLKAQRCIAAAKKHAPIDIELEIISETDTNHLGCPKMVEMLASKAHGEYLCFLGDDTIPKPDYLSNALNVMSTFPDSIGLVGFNDNHQSGEIFATHWIIHRDLLPLIGTELFHTGFHHNYCDNDLMARCIKINRYKFAPDAIVAHDHPSITGKTLTTDYSQNLPYWGDDKRLFLRRQMKRNVFKLGIGLPLTDLKVDTPFFLSWTVMEKPDFTLYMPKHVSKIDQVRNMLVEQALDEGCTHLLMMDTDQVYPPDTIKKLLSHNKDVTGVMVHRRYPPFDPILYQGELGKYVHVPDDECYSNQLVEVNATGCGCLVYNMECFLDIDPPWFEFKTLDNGQEVGEDIMFCHKLKEAGKRIFVDTSINVEHLTTMTITREMYKLYKAVTGFRYREEENVLGQQCF